MVEKYKDVNDKKIEEGLNELMKFRVNQVLSYSGPFSLARAAENYFSMLKLAEDFGIDCKEYENKIKEFEDEVNGVNKLEKEVKQ